MSWRRRVQALYRKGDAQLGLGRVAEAKDTLTMAYRLDSTNKQVSSLLLSVSSKLRCGRSDGVVTSRVLDLAAGIKCRDCLREWSTKLLVNDVW